MKLRNKHESHHEENAKNETEIAEVSEFHDKRIRRETKIEIKKESSIKPSGNSEYEQLVAEEADFNTKPMIEEAAFYIAKQRGFAPGSEMSDWFQAEAEVEGLLRSTK